MLPVKIDVPAMVESEIQNVKALEAALLTLPQANIETRHSFHAGMYARSITVPAGIAMTGVTIKIPTFLIVNGHASIYIGADVIEVNGYKVFSAAPGRRQALVTHAETDFTMVFPTDATTVEEAECQFTDEVELLASRNGININTVSGGA